MVEKVGLDPDTAGRPIPGTVRIPGREFLYVSDGGRDDFSSLFEELTNKATVPRAQSGGVMAENCRLLMPDGRVFHALSYKGDVEGWRLDLQGSAQGLGLQTGSIVDGAFMSSDGRSIPLSACTVYFY